MQGFMNHDFNITNIKVAMYVMPGKGAPVHHDRAYHGLAINLNSDPAESKEYIFSNGRTILVGQNEIIYMPKGSSYTVRSKGSGNCYAISFDISEDICFEPFSFTAKNAHAFIKEFERAAELWKGKKPAFHMQCKAILYHILSMMQREYHTKYMAKSTAAMIVPAVEYIHSHYTDEYISIAEMARMCKISEDYFRKIFKNVYGISPRKYINELKLSHAQDLIKSGMYTVTEGAELSGFMDMSYFSREFKKAFGVCPSEYLKEKNI